MYMYIACGGKICFAFLSYVTRSFECHMDRNLSQKHVILKARNFFITAS
jgi:hypothetical protein